MRSSVLVLTFGFVATCIGSKANQESPEQGPMSAMASLLMARSPEVAAAAKAAKSASSKPWKSQMSFTDRMLAGAGSRGMTQTLLQPIDVMRTRMQAKNIASALTAGSFVKGIIPQFTLAVPAGALQFTGYEWAKDQFAKAGATGGALVEMASAAAGALCASFIRVPQEVMKQRCMAGIYPNVFAGIKTLMETEGPGGLYKGYFATISRDIPFNMLSFMFFAQAKKMFKTIKGRASDVQENLAMGALCGMTAAVIMTPVDVIKTRLMTSDASSIVGTFNSILKEEGAATLMKVG